MRAVNHSALPTRGRPYPARMDERHGRYRRRTPDPRRRPSDGYRTLTRAQFEAMVDDAVDSLPAPLLDRVDNLAVVVEDVPPEDALPGGEPTILLGLYEGVPQTERGFDAPWLPDRVTIYRRPHELRARTRRELAALVRETLVHEIAHHFGIDDDRLDELGWG